jgi:hypothetical protein
MKNASYCIFNTKYTKEEYERIVPTLIQSMRQRGEWGEFFPMRIAPFAYNTSAAIDYFPIVEAQASDLNAPWFHEPATSNIDLQLAPPTIAEIKEPSIVRCRITGTPYKIIDQEIRFYREEGLPPPDVCFAERSRKRFVSSDPHRLWPRQCSLCSKQIQTTYAPGRREVVYCEECYLATVY